MDHRPAPAAEELGDDWGKASKGSRKSGKALDAQVRASTRGRERRPRTRKGTRPKWADGFLREFARLGIVKYAAESVGVNRRTVQKLRERDAEFAVEMEDALEEANDVIDREIYRRGVEGVTEPVVSAGKHVADVRKYSDALLMFQARGRRPEVYRERHDHRVDAKVETRTTGVLVVPGVATEEEWEAGLEAAAAAGKPKDQEG